MELLKRWIKTNPLCTGAAALGLGQAPPVADWLADHPDMESWAPVVVALIVSYGLADPPKAGPKPPTPPSAS